VINEAVELTKLYGADGAYKLINTSLDKISQELRSSEI
jgi:N utilization substance protein B